jgi:eukaryotic-like serine/threonine-protein kinase
MWQVTDRIDETLPDDAHARFHVSRLGRVIAGTYRVTRHIGSGASSHVYEAEHIRLGKPFAVKLLRPEVEPMGPMGRRFRREAMLVATVRNEHVVSVVDCGEHEGTPYIVMELCDGEDLRRLLNHEGALPARRALGIVSEAARGAHAMHKAGLVHRDLKPENLFVARRCTGEDWCKVLDLGVVKAAVSCSTAPGAIVGTIRYMAPEQLVNSGSVDATTDVYALGAILYECLSGLPAHDGESIEEIMFQILNGTPRSLSESCRELPNSLCSLVMACLSKDRGMRPATAEALAEALASMLDRPLSLPSSETIAEAIIERPARAGRRLTMVALVVGAITTLALLIGFRALSNSRAPSKPRDHVSSRNARATIAEPHSVTTISTANIAPTMRLREPQTIASVTSTLSAQPRRQLNQSRKSPPSANRVAGAFDTSNPYGP